VDDEGNEVKVRHGESTGEQEEHNRRSGVQAHLSFGMISP
jgi:hypothetical protein